MQDRRLGLCRKPSSWTKKTPEPLRRIHQKKFILENDGPFKVLQVRNHTVTVDVSGAHVDVPIDQLMFAKIVEKAIQAAEVERHDDVL